MDDILMQDFNEMSQEIAELGPEPQQFEPINKHFDISGHPLQSSTSLPLRSEVYNGTDTPHLHEYEMMPVSHDFLDSANFNICQLAGTASFESTSLDQPTFDHLVSAERLILGDDDSIRPFNSSHNLLEDSVSFNPFLQIDLPNKPFEPNLGLEGRVSPLRGPEQATPFSSQAPHLNSIYSDITLMPTSPLQSYPTHSVETHCPPRARQVLSRVRHVNSEWDALKPKFKTYYLELGWTLEETLRTIHTVHGICPLNGKTLSRAKRMLRKWGFNKNRASTTGPRTRSKRSAGADGHESTTLAPTVISLAPLSQIPKSLEPHLYEDQFLLLLNLDKYIRGFLDQVSLATHQSPILLMDGHDSFRISSAWRLFTFRRPDMVFHRRQECAKLHLLDRFIGAIDQKDCNPLMMTHFWLGFLNVDVEVLPWGDSGTDGRRYSVLQERLIAEVTGHARNSPPEARYNTNLVALLDALTRVTRKDRTETARVAHQCAAAAFASKVGWAHPLVTGMCVDYCTQFGEVDLLQSENPIQKNTAIAPYELLFPAATGWKWCGHRPTEESLFHLYDHAQAAFRLAKDHDLAMRLAIQLWKKSKLVMQSSVEESVTWSVPTWALATAATLLRDLLEHRATQELKCRQPGSEFYLQERRSGRVRIPKNQRQLLRREPPPSLRRAAVLVPEALEILQDGDWDCRMVSVSLARSLLLDASDFHLCGIKTLELKRATELQDTLGDDSLQSGRISKLLSQYRRCGNMGRCSTGKQVQLAKEL